MRSPAKISVAHISNVLDPINSTRVSSAPWTGRSAADYATELYGIERCEFSINGARVGANAIPDPGDQLIICPIPGDGAGDALRMVAMIAITVYAPYAAASLLGTTVGALTFGGQLLSAGIMAGGYMAVNAILPSTQISGIKNRLENIETSTNYGWGNPSNAWQEGSVIPKLIGERRFAPPRIGGYRYTPDDDRETQRLRMQFAMCANKIAGLDASGGDIWINERSLADYPEVAFEYTTGIDGEDIISSWFEDTYTETTVNEELQDAEISTEESVFYSDFTAGTYKPTTPYAIGETVTAIGITFHFPYNLNYQATYYDYEYDYYQYAYDPDFRIKIRYREVGGSTWTEIEWKPKLKYPRSIMCKKEYKYCTYLLGNLTPNDYELGFTYSGSHGDLGFDVTKITSYSTLSSLPTQVTTGTDIESLKIGLYFPYGLFYLTNSGGTGNHTVTICVTIRPYGETDWTASRLITITDATRDAFRKIVEFKALDADQWEVCVFFSGTPNTGTRYTHTCYFEYLQEGIDLAVSYQGVAVLSLDIPANESLNNTWPTVEVRSRSLYPDTDYTRAYFGPEYWTIYLHGSWNSTYHYYTATSYSGYELALNPTGGWESGYQPTYVRAAFSTDYLHGGANTVYIRDTNNALILDIGTDYYYGEWLEINWGSYDILRIAFQSSAIFNVTSIEFSDERLCDSSNPASAGYHKLVDDYGVDTDDIDIDAFYAWEDYCYRHRLTVSGYQDTQMTRRAVLDLIGEAGRAVIRQIGSTWTVLIDDIDDPVQTFSSDNIIEGTFEESFRSSQDMANTVVVYFYDAANNNRKTPIKVRSPNIDNDEGEKITEHTLYWVDNIIQATKYAIRLLNATLLATRTLSWQSDIDAINCTVGNVVYFQNDLPIWGVTPGRVVSSTSTTVTCDIPLDFDDSDWNGRDLRILIRHTAPKSGEYVEYLERLEITNPYPNTGVVTYTLASGNWERNPEVGCLVLIGWVTGTGSSTGEELLSVKKVRIIDISHSGSTQRRQITANEYYDDMYDESDVEIILPDSESGLELYATPDSAMAYNIFGRAELDYIALAWRGNASIYYIFYRMKQVGSGDYEWQQRFDNRYWEPSSNLDYGSITITTPATWDSENETWDNGLAHYTYDNPAFYLIPKGSWPANYRPTHFRITYDDSGSAKGPFYDFFIKDTAGNFIVQLNHGDDYDSGEIVEINWQGYDIASMYIMMHYNDASWITISNIEFYDLGQWSTWRFLQSTSQTRLNIENLPSGHEYQFSVSVYNGANESNITELYYEGTDRETALDVIDDCIHALVSDEITLTTYQTLTVNDCTHALTSDQVSLS